MKGELLTDIGENYEYIRTIVANKLELFKIDSAEKVGRIIGGFIVAILIGVLVVLISISLLLIVGILLAKSLGSVIGAIAIIMGVFFVFAILIWTFRHKIIMRPIASMIFELIINEEDDN